MKIKAKKTIYKGYKQGYKVYIDGKKYPLKFGYCYTTMDENTAINDAIDDYKKYYNLEFSSIKSMLNYNICINKRTGYYEIQSNSGVIKSEGYSIINLNECNYNQLNNFAYNCILEFLNIPISKINYKKQS